jgi:hypothetical protein
MRDWKLGVVVIFGALSLVVVSGFVGHVVFVKSPGPSSIAQVSFAPIASAIPSGEAKSPTKTTEPSYLPSQTALEANPDVEIGKMFDADGCVEEYGYAIGWIGEKSTQLLASHEYAKARTYAKASLRGINLCGGDASGGVDIALSIARFHYVIAASYVAQGDTQDAPMEAAAASVAAEAVADNPDNSSSNRSAARKIKREAQDLIPDAPGL